MKIASELGMSAFTPVPHNPSLNSQFYALATEERRVRYFNSQVD